MISHQNIKMYLIFEAKQKYSGLDSEKTLSLSQMHAHIY